MDLLARTLLRQYDSEPNDLLAHRLVATMRRQIGASSSKEDEVIYLLNQLAKEVEKAPKYLLYGPKPSFFDTVKALCHKVMELPEEIELTEDYVPSICTCGCERDLNQDIFH